MHFETVRKRDGQFLNRPLRILPLVISMVFCLKCGKELPEDGYFCPNCGVRAQKGVEAGVSVPVEELREAFAKIGQEMEKAFRTAAKEIDAAFKTVREDVRESKARATIVCSECGQKNSGDASYCFNCGKRLGQR